MRTLAISFFNKDGKSCNELDGVLGVFERNGFTVTNLIMVSPSDREELKKNLISVKGEIENIVVIDNLVAEYDIKEVIAEVYKTGLTENSSALSFIFALSKSNGLEIDSKFAILPLTANLIPNINGIYQGFYIEDGKTSIALLPSEEKQFRVMSESYLFPYYEGKFHITKRKETFKYFGQREQLINILQEAKKIADENFSYFIRENNGDFTVTLFFTNVQDRESGKIVFFIVDKLKGDIYAESEESLSERLFKLLKHKSLKISTAESFTGGRIASDIVSNIGASEVLVEGIVAYSNESKIERLNVKRENIEKEGAVSSIVAYQMAVGLLSQNNCDIAISTTGIAGPNSDGTNKPVGLCFIGVGTKDGVHTYKLNLKGTREEITERAKNTALFLAINRIKNI